MFKKRLKAVTATAMLTALSVVFERVLTVTPPSNMLDFRITFADIPIILAGIFVSPVMGGVSGVVSDIVGCFVSGYPPFPILTVSPLIMGFLPGFIIAFAERKIPFFGKKTTCMKNILVALSVIVSNIISSFVVTTYGLSVMRGVEFLPMLITRIPSCCVGIVINTVFVCLLYTPLKGIIKKL